MMLAVSQIEPAILKLVRSFAWRDGDSEPKGTMRMWEPPIAGHRYGIGCDPAFGIEGGDRTVIQIVSRTTDPCEQVFEAEGRWDPEILDRLLYALHRWYNRAYIVIESQGGGLTVARRLLNLYGCHKLYKRRNDKRVARPVTDELGYHRTEKDGETLRALRDALREEKLLIRSEHLIDEMGRLEWFNPKDDPETGFKAGDNTATLKLRGGGGAGVATSPDCIRAMEYAWLAVCEAGKHPEDEKPGDNRWGDMDDLRKAGFIKDV